MHILIIGLAGLVFSLALPVELWAQITDKTNTSNGTNGALRIYKYDARATALGDATVGDHKDLSAINMNPAALSFVKNNIYSVEINSMQNWNNNMMLENITFPVFKYYDHTFAGQLAIHHPGIEKTNILGTYPYPQPDLLMYQIDLAYSVSFQEVLSIGIFNNFTYAENDNAQYWTYYPVFGLMYAPSQSISYGVVFRGIGRSVTYLMANNGITALGSQNLRESLELGATLLLPVETDNASFSVSLSNEKQFGEKGLWYKAGIEVMGWTFAALRGGLLIQPETKVYAPRFGLGIVTNVIEMEYAISYDNRLYERYHQVGLTLHLDKIKK
jgi:hypothetical protein